MTLTVAELNTADPTDVAAREGRDDAHAGLPVTAAPYKPGTPEHNAWAQAWIDTVGYQRDFNGQMHTDTTAARAQVAADFRAAGYDRPDPCDEILGIEPQRPAPFVGTRGGVVLFGPRVLVSVQVLVDTQRISDQLSAAFARMEELASASGDHLKDALKALIAPPDAGTLRGTVYVCPRHGPQPPGGTCRACTRPRTRSTR